VSCAFRAPLSGIPQAPGSVVGKSYIFISVNMHNKLYFQPLFIELPVTEGISEQPAMIAKYRLYG
jgi:hypothetical protein